MKNIFLDLNKFEEIGKIGEGGFGEVVKVIKKGTNQIYAAKISKKKMDKGSKEELMSLLREVNLLSQMNHPSVLKFIGFSSVNFKNKSHPVIVTEFLSNGSLKDILDQERQGLAPQGWDNTKKLITLYGIASAMAYLHSNNIIHRDLKPENVLENEYLFPVISDFGLSKVNHTNDQSMTQQSVVSLKGTIMYIAPEILASNEYSKEGDIYAYGLLAYEVITGQKPYEEILTQYQLISKLQKGERPFISEDTPECYKDLIESCWSQNPLDRPPFEQIEHNLKNDERFRIDEFNIVEFEDYTELIKEAHASFESKKPFNIDQILKQGEEKNSFKKVILNIQHKAIGQKVHEIDPNELETQNIMEKLSKTKNLKDLPEETIDLIKSQINQGSSDTRKFFLYPDMIEMLHKNGSLKSSNFQHLLKFFDKLSITINYPSDNFDEIMKDIHKIKKKVSDTTVKVNISELKVIDKKLSQNTVIDVIYANPPLETIESEAFRGCSSLIEVSLPFTLTTIGNFAFSECSSLNKIAIQNSVTSIGAYAFNECSSLTKFEIPPSVVSINEYTFNGCSFLNQVTIPYSVKSIGPNAFNECKNLIELKLPSSIDSIAEHAFSECSSITNLAIPPNIKEIDNFAFAECSSLTEVRIPNSVSSIGNGSFRGCSSLKKLIVPNSLLQIGDNALANCTSLEEFVIPPSITKINDGCFNGCKALKNISIPSSVIEIKDHAFEGCSQLTEINIPSSVAVIGSYAFNECSLLESIEIPSSVTEINEFSFGCCSRLSKITVPSSITRISSFAFSECSSLESIEIPSSVAKIDCNAFCGCSSLKKLSIPNSITEIESYLFAECSSLIEISLPSSVTKIGDYAFCGCISLKSIEFPSSLISIGNWSFFNCSELKELKIPSLVESIGESAFSRCSALSKISISSSVKSIGKYAFSGCLSLEKVDIPPLVNSLENGVFSACKSLDKIIIPSNVRRIGGLAFKGCSSLKNISIPNSIVEIGEKAFSDCTEITELSIPSILKKSLLHKYLGIDKEVLINYI
ncbi:hypothetical protein M9Y10_026990 [Tritrichomonas musculus]|uniref:Protein kinase domain-containing protein n=1 Tax=Tritrichomonas musculus TaxID=1915356 RepID=A0ABR2H594_9EUKA